MENPRQHYPPPDPERLAFFLLKDVRKAIREYGMLNAGDRLAVAVSGGKDSLSLLRLLNLYRRSAETPFGLAAIHVRGDATGITPLHPPLEDWLAAEALPYRIVQPELSPDETFPLTCQRCTWLRRKALFIAADELRCNVVAYAHHADDVAQTTLLNLVYGGTLRTLQPCADYFAGRFRLIRPLIYTPESELARFAALSSFPCPPQPCPRSESSRRRRISEMLKLLGRDYLTQGRINLIRAGLAAGRETSARD